MIKRLIACVDTVQKKTLMFTLVRKTLVWVLADVTSLVSIAFQVGSEEVTICEALLFRLGLLFRLKRLLFVSNILHYYYHHQ